MIKGSLYSSRGLLSSRPSPSDDLVAFPIAPAPGVTEIDFRVLPPPRHPLGCDVRPFTGLQEFRITTTQRFLRRKFSARSMAPAPGIVNAFDRQDVEHGEEKYFAIRM